VNVSDYILVIGDGMIDKHIFGNSYRLSPEAPVPIIAVDDETTTLGGAANVAAHITSANIPCLFAYKSLDYSINPGAIFFEEEHKGFLNILEHHNIIPIFLKHDKAHPLTIKKRIWTNKQQICRIDNEDTSLPDIVTENKWLHKIIETIENHNVRTIIMSDYNKGTLSDTFINSIADFAKSLNILTILDPKRPSFVHLHNLDIIKPNRKEISSTNMSTHKCSTILGDTYLVNTLGADGVDLWQKGYCILSRPTVAEEIFDVTGAGDSFNALLGIGMYMGLTIQQSICAANKAAAYTTKHIGCYCLTYDEIMSSIEYAKEIQL